MMLANGENKAVALWVTESKPEIIVTKWPRVSCGAGLVEELLVELHGIKR